MEESLFTTGARLATFQGEHRLDKRRASSQKKKGANAVSWPHHVPSPEDLARAGFYYKPISGSDDNVACYLCEVKLDGWEVGDIPLDEHLAHSKSCPWAVSLQCARKGEDRDPLSQALVDARAATYSTLWPHEAKKAWKPKVKKLVEAGWCYDPSSDDDVRDGVTCFYCNISLDGWEPKDDPLAEHQRRSPECTFFTLCEQYRSTRPEKAKRGRASTASRASRLSIQSVQSVQSTFSEAPSLMSLGDAVNQLDIDESLAAVDTTMTSDTTATKAKKKTTKAKAPTKTKRKTKKDELAESTLAVELEVEPVVEETPLAVENEEPAEAPQPQPVEELVSAPAKPTRGRKLKRADESQIEETIPVDPPVKPKRTTKAKTKKPETPPKRISQDESQLHSELQDAVSFQSALEEPLAPQEIKKGIKRTSDGVEKGEEAGDDTIQEVEPPVKPKKAPRAPRTKKGTKAAKATQDDSEVVMADADSSRQDAKPKRGRKPKKVQEEENEQESVAPVPVELEAAADKEAPDLAVDEQHIIQSEVATDHADQPADEDHLPTPAEDEYEPTPTPQKPYTSTVQVGLSPIRPTPQTSRIAPPPLSPGDSLHSSDAENRRPPSSSNYPNPTSTIKKSSANPLFAVPAPPSSRTATALEPSAWMSPSKSTRIPLAAPDTPTHRSPVRPLARVSPSKSNLLGANLVSENPWYPIDLDSVFSDGVNGMQSPTKVTPSKAVEARLADAGGVLSAAEMEMSVEEWVRWRAEEGDKRLREGCEKLVGVFEREGGRAMEVLIGIRGS